jgi:hypothetical protein
MVRLCWLIPLLLMAATSAVQACDVESFDPEDQLVLKHQEQVLRFKQGKANAFLLEEGQGKPEWELSVECSAVLHPEPGVAIRLVLVHVSHVQGSGALHLLVGLRCIGGKAKAVFRLEQPITRLEVLSEELFQVVSPQWHATDAMAFPSQEQLEVDAWWKPAQAFRRVQVLKTGPPE